MAAVARSRRGPPDADGARMNRFAHQARRIQLDEISRIKQIPGPAPGRRRSHLAGHRLVGPRRSVGVDATPGDRDRRPDQESGCVAAGSCCGHASAVWHIQGLSCACMSRPGGTRLGVAYPDPSLRSSVTPVLWTHCLVPRRPRPDLPKGSPAVPTSTARITARSPAGLTASEYITLMG